MSRRAWGQRGPEHRPGSRGRTRFVRRARLKLGMDCALWPCRRCNRAGRTSWRVREAWHQQRRERRTMDVLAVTGLLAAIALVLLWTSVLVPW